jgi:hypothetical protein
MMPPARRVDVPFESMIDCAKRELTMRGTTYTRLVRSGKMHQKDATREIETMRAILHTLLNLQDAANFRKSG